MVAPSRSWTACSGVCLGRSADDVTCEWYAVTMSLLTETQISDELATVPGVDP